MGFEGRTASSTVPEEAVPRLRASGGRVKPGSKPRAATADQLPARRAPARKAKPARESGNGEVAAGGATATAVLETPAPPPAPVAPAEPAPPPTPLPTVPAIRIPRGATAQDLAERLGSTAPEIVKTLFAAGEMVSITQ